MIRRPPRSTLADTLFPYATLVRSARARPGKGAEAMVSGVPAWVGSPRFAEASGVFDDAARRTAAALEDAGKTVVAVFRADRLVGLLALRDEPRPDAGDAVRSEERRVGKAWVSTGRFRGWPDN